MKHDSTSLKKPNISGIVDILKTHKALCDGYILPKASFRMCKSVTFPEIFLGHDYVSSVSSVQLLMLFRSYPTLEFLGHKSAAFRRKGS